MVFNCTTAGELTQCWCFLKSCINLIWRIFHFWIVQNFIYLKCFAVGWFFQAHRKLAPRLLSWWCSRFHVLVGYGRHDPVEDLMAMALVWLVALIWSAMQRVLYTIWPTCIHNLFLEDDLWHMIQIPMSRLQNIWSLHMEHTSSTPRNVSNFSTFYFYVSTLRRAAWKAIPYRI